MRSLCANKTQDLMATIDHDARPSLGRKQGLDFSAVAVFVCHTNEELMMKMKTMTLRIGGRSTLETSIRRWGFGSVRTGFFTFGLRIRFWFGFGEWFLFFASRILSVTVWSEGLSWGVDCLGSGVWNLRLLYIGTLGLSWVWGTSPGLTAQWTLVLSGFWAWI